MIMSYSCDYKQLGSLQLKFSLFEQNNSLGDRINFSYNLISCYVVESYANLYDLLTLQKQNCQSRAIFMATAALGNIYSCLLCYA